MRSQVRPAFIVLMMMFSTLSILNVSAIDPALYEGAQAGSIHGNSTIAAGGDHTCAIMFDGGIQCWGDNSDGQLGDGTTTNRYSPREVKFPGSNDAVDIALGRDHTCVIIDNGSVFCWGSNSDGQLGDGTTTDRVIPTLVNLQSSYRAVSISAGNKHTCVILQAGSLQCWGENLRGQIGDGTTTDRSSPVGVSIPSGRTGIAIGLGGEHSCAVLDNGSVYCWGYNSFGQIGDGTTSTRATPTFTHLTYPRIAVGVAGGGDHSCAMLDNGSVECWGSNSNGQIGDGTTTDRHIPTHIPGVNGVRVVTLSLGMAHSCAIVGNPITYCWGSNSYGELGDGTTVDNSTPVDIDMPNLWVANSISLGESHSCAILETSGIVCWGSNGAGQLGIGSNSNKVTARYIITPLSTNLLSAGDGYSCAIFNQGQLKCWGHNDHGQLGDGSTTDRNTPTSISLIGSRSAVSVSAGDSHTCVLIENGSVQCWGLNGDYQVGDGSTTERHSPRLVSLPSGLWAEQVSAGGFHTCAILSDKTLRCWGNNSNGQIGDGTTVDRSSPKNVSLPSGRIPIHVSAGYLSTCALLDDGSVRCWGSNGVGQLGDGSTTDRTTPAAVNLPTGRYALTIEIGVGHACAILDDFFLRCWGSNTYGQIGDGTTTGRTSPTSVSTTLTVMSFSIGTYGHTCAIFQNNQLRCWGRNLIGQVGDMTTTSRNTPTMPSTMSTLTPTSIGLGYHHSCAILDDNRMRCWGSNSHGQIGDGTSQTMRTWPTAVNGAADYLIWPSTTDDRDFDGDEVLNIYDRCLNGQTGWTASPASDYDWDGCRDSSEDTDDDNDGVLDQSDSCARGAVHWLSTSSSDHDSDGCRDSTEDSDDDNDGIFDSNDDCSTGLLNWNSSSQNDYDSDGCNDAVEDPDDDNDQVNDTLDDCPKGLLNWTSIPSSDHDGDGCSDFAEDDDDDNDGLNDSLDNCSTGDLGWNSSSVTDYDSDGCQDSNEDTDDDNDGVSDTSDSCSKGDLGWSSTGSTDHDSDGCQDSSEDPDDDNDGVADSSDDCGTGDLGWVSNSLTDYDSDGCRDSGEDPDDDNDGVADGSDDCDNGELGWQSDSSNDYDSDGCEDTIEDTDDDGDGVEDGSDSCRLGDLNWNSGASTDHDSDGCRDDGEDTDDDDDGITDILDVCPRGLLTGPDPDGDGCKNAEDNDDDADGVDDTDDAFPLDPSESIDTDGDGIGNNADLDDDGDGMADLSDAFPLDSSETHDTDGDGVGDNADLDDDDDGVLDESDAFPLDANEHVDTDGDGIGNNADPDDDGDGVADAADAFPLDSTETTDTDGDGVGDNADLDDDDDGWSDATEAECGQTDPRDPASAPVDTDNDGICDYLENDNDADGVPNSEDAFPTDSTESVDTDGDGIGNNADQDDDGDGVTDSMDAFPLDSTESLDTDEDGIGNNQDEDDDGDGWDDSEEQSCGGTNPLDSDSIPLDTDGDAECDVTDPDDDGDGVADESDAFPLDPTESIDTDGDGVGNNADMDDDGDGVPDMEDTFPLDSTRSSSEASDGSSNSFILMAAVFAIVICIAIGLVIVRRRSNGQQHPTFNQRASQSGRQQQYVPPPPPPQSARPVGGSRQSDGTGPYPPPPPTGQASPQQVRTPGNDGDLIGHGKRPPTDLNGVVSSDGYEWLDYGDAKWYRVENSGSEWTKWQ